MNETEILNKYLTTKAELEKMRKESPELTRLVDTVAKLNGMVADLENKAENRKTNAIALERLGLDLGSKTRSFNARVKEILIAMESSAYDGEEALIDGMTMGEIHTAFQVTKEKLKNCNTRLEDETVEWESMVKALKNQIEGQDKTIVRINKELLEMKEKWVDEKGKVEDGDDEYGELQNEVEERKSAYNVVYEDLEKTRKKLREAETTLARVRCEKTQDIDEETDEIQGIEDELAGKKVKKTEKDPVPSKPAPKKQIIKPTTEVEKKEAPAKKDTKKKAPAKKDTKKKAPAAKVEKNKKAPAPPKKTNTPPATKEVKEPMNQSAKMTELNTYLDGLPQEEHFTVQQVSRKLFVQKSAAEVLLNTLIDEGRISSPMEGIYEFKTVAAPKPSAIFKKAEKWINERPEDVKFTMTTFCKAMKIKNDVAAGRVIEEIMNAGLIYEPEIGKFKKV